MRVALFAAALVIAATGGVALAVRGDDGPPRPAPVRVGTGPEFEATLLAELTRALLAAHGTPATTVEFGSSADARSALELGVVDVLPSYTGAVWLDEFGLGDPPKEPEESYERVARIDRANDLTWLPPTKVNATFAFVVRAADAARVSTLENLGPVVNVDRTASLCVDEEFAQRPDGLAVVVAEYFLAIIPEQVRLASADDAVTLVASGECFAGLTTATDGRAVNLELVALADVRPVFPAFVLAPVMRDRVLAEHPEVVPALAPLTVVTDQQLAGWNAQLLRGESVQAVIAAALAALPTPSPTSTPTA